MIEAIQAAATALPEPWWQHGVEILITGTLPIIALMFRNRYQARLQMAAQQEKDRKERLEEQEKIRKDMEEKHKENAKQMSAQNTKLDELLNERKYLPAHGHRENTGPLTAENIFPKR